jgi:hypothetical protein
MTATEEQPLEAQPRPSLDLQLEDSSLLFGWADVEAGAQGRSMSVRRGVVMRRDVGSGGADHPPRGTPRSRLRWVAGTSPPCRPRPSACLSLSAKRQAHSFHCRELRAADSQARRRRTRFSILRSPTERLLLILQHLHRRASRGALASGLHEHVLGDVVRTRRMAVRFSSPLTAAPRARRGAPRSTGASLSSYAAWSTLASRRLTEERRFDQWDRGLVAVLHMLSFELTECCAGTGPWRLGKQIRNLNSLDRAR